MARDDRGADRLGHERREVILRKTHHGPILGVDDEGRPLAVRLARLDEGGWFHQWYEMERARSLAEWKQAMSRLNVAYMNTMYADRDGNILYIYNSAVPRRSTSTTGEARWTAAIPAPSGTATTARRAAAAAPSRDRLPAELQLHAARGDAGPGMER